MARKSPRPRRSGLIDIKYESTKHKNAMALQAHWTKVTAPAAVRDMLEAMFTRAEGYAFDVYGKYGLPQASGGYIRTHEGWAQAEEVEACPGDAATSQRPRSYFHFELGLEAPEDSELFFAARLLERVNSCRVMAQLGKWSPERAFVEGWGLAQDLGILALEFDLADIIEPAAKQAKGRNVGTEISGPSRKNTSARKVRHWLEIDEDLKPASRMQRATVIAKRVKGTDFEASVRTIRGKLPERKKLAGS